MNSARDRSHATAAGVLFLTATAAGVASLPFSGVYLAEPDFLPALAEHTSRVYLGAVLHLVMAVSVAAIPVAMYPVLQRHGQSMALGSVIFRALEGVSFMVGIGLLVALLALGQAGVGSEAATPRALRAAMEWAYNGFGSVAFCLGALLYYLVFWRARLVPRWLSGWGAVGVAVSLVATVASMLAGLPGTGPLALVSDGVVALNELVLAVWLIARGFSVEEGGRGGPAS